MNELNFIQQALQIGIWKWFPESGELVWDESLYEIYGVDPQIPCSFELWKSLVHPEDFENLMSEADIFLKNPGTYFKYEFRCVTPAGDEKWLKSIGYFVEDHNGPMMIGLNYALDQGAIEGLDINSLGKVDLHQSKLAALGEFSGGLAHEINNPLAVAKGHCLMMKKLLKSNCLNPEKMANSLEKQLKSFERIEGMIKNWKSVLRMDEAEYYRFELFSAIRPVIEMVKEFYISEGIEFSFKFPSDEFHVMGNAGQLQHVFLNLLSNAKDATRNQDIRHVRLEIEILDKRVLISVVDNGVGIDEMVLEKIFLKFFTTKKSGEGCGLGLHLANQIVNNHQGNLNCESSPGKGSRFIVDLPLFSEFSPHAKKCSGV